MGAFMKVKAIVIRQHGGPEVLTYEDVEVGEPGPGEVRIRHTAIGVNFIDSYKRAGLYPVEFPAIIGDEGVGVVEAVGAGVTEFRLGDRVGYGAIHGGAYAERRLGAACDLIGIPDGIDDEVAAASVLRGLTCEYLVRRLYPLKRGETVLVHAAAGGLGLILCQWCKHIGATVIGTVSSEAKAEVARTHGCDHPILYTEVDFADMVKAITGGKLCDVVYDSVGKDTFMKSLDCVRPRGMMVSFGNASGKPDPFDVLELSKRGSLFLTRPTLYAYTRDRGELVAAAAAYFDLVRSGAIKVTIGNRFPLRDAGAAHRALTDRSRTGAPILIP
jgi:NADPH2:quinone reductase